MAKNFQTTDSLHPARLLVSAALSPADFNRKFQPKISNTPALPKIDWGAIGAQAPQLPATPNQLPQADAVVVTWAESEWAAMQHVFCGSNTTMPYTKRNEGSWSGWVKYDDGAPSGLGYWGYYRLVGVGSAQILLFKSNAHYAASNGEQNLEELVNRFLQTVKPELILSVGTAGGARTSDPIGTVNVVRSDTLYESNQPQTSWPNFANSWSADWSVLGAKGFAKLLFPVPTTAADLKSIVKQFNQFYHSNYSMNALNPDNLNMGASAPAINNMTGAGTALLTAKSFVVATTSGNLSKFACVEMDDAIIARTASGKTAFGSLRNISDPIQSAALPEAFQGHWGEAIYTAYGLYTSFNGALAASAVLMGQFAAKSPTSRATSLSRAAGGSIGAATHVTLRGSTRYLRPGSRVIGRSDGQEWSEVLVKVRRQAALPEPDPNHPLSRAELARYGADPKDLDLVEHELSRYGVTVEAKNPTTRSVTAAGPVSAMEQAFGVRLFDVEHLGVRYRGRTGDIYIPRNLDGVVTAVFGLDTRPMIKRIPRRVIHVAASATASAAQRLWFYPAELAQAYQFPKADGSNQVIGILEFEGTFNPSDLQQFWKLGGTSGPVPRVNVVQVEALPPSQANDPDGTGETMLDVEVVAAVCPKAAIRIYVSAFTEKGWVSNLDAALSDKTSPTVISISYSYPEGVQPWTQQAVDEVNESLKELANAGITVCVSSGDDGSSDGEDDGLAHVGFPATSPYVLAVGGTSLNRRTGTEVVWREGTGVRPDGGATGAGVSAMNPRPSWQSAFKDIQSVNPHAPAGRILPDVSANAALNTGYRIYTSGWQTVGGTSAATPLWAALIARLQQLGKKVGFLTPRLYAPTPKTNGQPLGKAACRDVVSGSNASGNAEGYSAGSGFDAASGWGSPNGQKLLNSL